MWQRRRMFVGGTAALFVGAMTGLAGPAGAQSSDLVVFAAASLKNVLDAAAARWRQESGLTVRVSYAASSALARQIEQGAPADLFLSADLDWMDYVDQRRLLKPGTRVNLARNRLVLIAPRSEANGLDLGSRDALAHRLAGGRLAMASVDSVPAGKYGRAALQSLGLWSGVARQVAQAENVRAALMLVARGEAKLGIVYRTDAAAEPSVAIVATFPEASHMPIVYPGAVTAQSRHPRAHEFLAYLAAPTGRSVFEAHGFAALAPGQS